jgi:maltooligosyltrehalose trehalohydrolase
VANSARGQRIQELTTPGRLRAMTALLLLMPGTPMLFQGQEFGASCPFRYFADHEEDLARAVREGRAKFLTQFKSIQSNDMLERLTDPADGKTFSECKLDDRERQNHRESYDLHRDLLRLRREDAVFRAQRTDWLHGAVLAPEAFALRFFGGEEGDRLLVVNLGRDLKLEPVPEPLLAPPEDSHWEVIWSSEAAQYGGNGTPAPDPEGRWHIAGHAALVLGPKKIARLYHG